jgi:activating signal cointegrator 1
MPPTQIPGYRFGHVPAISLWQPWASAWLSPIKYHETRSWETLRRGPLVVHASKTRTCLRLVEPQLERLLADQFGPTWLTDLPLGALIGTVELIDCERIGETMFSSGASPVDYADHVAGDWSDGRFAWKRGAFQRFDRPIPFAGRQGFFYVPTSILPASWSPRLAA